MMPILLLSFASCAASQPARKHACAGSTIVSAVLKLMIPGWDVAHCEAHTPAHNTTLVYVNTRMGGSMERVYKSRYKHKVVPKI
jgi:hypothetical protein